MTHRLDALSDLVLCDRYRAAFPSGMPRRGCLRRQFEAKREGKAWAPAHPGCMGCPLGREVREEVERAGVALGTCSKCGAAIVGADACAVCDEKRSIHEVRPREAPRPPTQDRIWTGKVPDVAISAPPASARPAKRPVTFGPPPSRPPPKPPAPSAPVNTEKPAQPAEEEKMPKGYARGAPCKTCEATGVNPALPGHPSGCQGEAACSPACPPRPEHEPVTDLELWRVLDLARSVEELGVEGAPMAAFAVARLARRMATEISGAREELRALRLRVGDLEDDQRASLDALDKAGTTERSLSARIAELEELLGPRPLAGVGQPS